MKRTVLNDHICYRAETFFQRTLNNNCFSFSRRISFQFHDLCLKQDGLKKLIDPHSCMCRYRNEFILSAPVRCHNIQLCKLCFDIIRIRSLFIHFVDRNDKRYTCRFGMCDRFFCLRHNTVICRNNDNNDISCLCTTGTHLCKCFMARSIDKGDFLSVLLYLICTNMLCDSACLFVCHSG